MDSKKAKPRSRRRYTKEKPSRVDPKCQEATPEILRIEIDQIFKEFLDDPDKKEHIFPSNLNNLQRKYIHNKAQAMNLSSRSYGKEPNRNLHIKKKDEKQSNQNFQLSFSTKTNEVLTEFASNLVLPFHKPSSIRTHSRRGKNHSLVSSLNSVPSILNSTVEIMQLRMQLPIWDYRENILQSIWKNQVVVILSETGSGKTTQVPQFILEEMQESSKPCKIICTQPRRISTLAAAERVAYERQETLGSTVGYHIKLEQRYGFNTNLIYCTTGVLLRCLMGKIDDDLENITHIIVDEIHERDKLTDFLLICLKQMLPKYPHLKVILMSATVIADKFIQYFNQGESLSIPGRLYPVDCLFLERILMDMNYKSPKMLELESKEKNTKQEFVLKNNTNENEINPCMDSAIDDYLNFATNYDYKVHFEEATAQIIMLLFSEDVPVDYRHSQTGKTALMIAAHLGDREFINRLCRMGADLDVRDFDGKTALDHAKDEETHHLLTFIKRQFLAVSSGQSEEQLLHLYDKTVSEDIIDYDVLTTLVTFIHRSGQPGSILIFFPGYDDIMLCNTRLAECDLNPETYQVFFLHSSMNIRDQTNVFKNLPNKRKIILSTNIAETSITINDVVFVIDCGKAKEKCYDSYNKVSSLQVQWISKACAKQRMGRAGRTKPGICFRLYSKQRFDYMEEERIPEILRVSLEELCLHSKILAPDGMNIHDFLALAPDPPSMNSIRVAIEHLQFLGALDKEEDLTTLGEYLAQLSIEPHLGKMVLYSVIFRCLDPVLTIVASMTHKDPFQLPPQANLKTYAAEKRKELLQGVLSDHLLYIEIFRLWQEKTRKNRVQQFCSTYFLSQQTMNFILETRSQLMAQLRALNFLYQNHCIEGYNTNSNSWALVKAVLSTGLYPNIAYPSNGNLSTRREKKITIQNGSICANQHFNVWLVYDELIQRRTNFVIRNVTAITPISVSLLCGTDVLYPSSNSINIDDWLEFQAPNSHLNFLRKSVNRLIKGILENPQGHYSNYEVSIIETVRKVLDLEEIHSDLAVPISIGEKPIFLHPKHGAVNKKGNSNLQQKASKSSAYYVSEASGGPLPDKFRFSRYGNYPDEKIFILIKPRQLKNVEIAFNTSRWIFAPQTEKKVLFYSEQGRPIYLVFTVSSDHAFNGLAEFLTIYNESKPTATIQWIFRCRVPYSCTKHLKNEYYYNRPLFDGLDGQIIQQDVGEELYKIFENLSMATLRQKFGRQNFGDKNFKYQ